MRVAANDRAVYRARSITALLAGVATGWLILSFQVAGGASYAIGQHIFYFQSWTAFAIAAFACGSTCDAISAEKRQDTLGLLFLTHLRGYDVVLGKLAARTTVFAAGLLAALPMVSLPVLMGGVYIGQSFNLLLSVLNTALFSASVGLFCSSLCVRRQSSHTLALLTMLAICVLLPVFAFSLKKLGVTPGTQFLILIFSPYFAHSLASGSMAGLQAGYFYTSLGITFSMSLLLLIATSFITPRSWQQRVKEPLFKRLAQRHAAWMLRTIRSRSKLGAKLLDRNAYEWLCARRLSARSSAWNFITCIVILATLLILKLTRDFDLAPVLMSICVPAVYLLEISIKTRVGGHAADRFSEDRESGALELILTTPLTIREMIAGEFRALVKLFLLPTLAVIALLGISLWLSMGGIDRLSELFTPDGGALFRRRGIIIALSTILFIAVDCVTLAWVGVWFGLAVKSGVQARGNTMAVVMAGPLLVFGAFAPVLAQFSIVRAFLESAGFNTLFAMTIVYAIGFNLIVLLAGRRWLLTKAREHFSNPKVVQRNAPMLAWLRNVPKFRLRRISSIEAKSV